METKQCSSYGGEIMASAKKCKQCCRWLEDTPKQPLPDESISFELQILSCTKTENQI